MAGESHPPMMVRRATPQDARAIARNYIDTWQDTYASVLPVDRLAVMSRPTQIQAWSERIRRLGASYNSSDDVVVATRGGAVVGFGDCGLNRRIEYPYRGEVFTLYVTPDRQGLGAGRQMLRALFRHLITAHINSVLIWALRDNPNRHFYSAMHGEIVAERSSRYWGREVVELAYAWPDLSKWALTVRAELRNTD